MNPLFETMHCIWDGDFSHSDQGWGDSAAGFLVGDGGARIASFRSQVLCGGRSGVVDAQTADHVIRIEADEDAFRAHVDGRLFIQIGRAQGDLWEGFDHPAGQYARFCCKKACTTIPYIPSEPGTAMASLVWEGREIVGLCIGPGRAYGREPLAGRRFLRTNITSDRDAIAALVVALLETAFFGIIGADKREPGKPTPATHFKTSGGFRSWTQ